MTRIFTFELDAGNGIALKIIYDPDDPDQWKNVKICKMVNEEDTAEWLKDDNAAVLKFLLDRVREKDTSFIGQSDWPKGVSGGSKVYRRIRKFLGVYEYHLYSEKGRGKGVRWIEKDHVEIAQTEQSEPPSESNHNDMIIGRSDDFAQIGDYRSAHQGIVSSLFAAAEDLCLHARNSGRLIPPAQIPKSEQVKLPVLHAKAELTRNEQTKTLRELIGELSSVHSPLAGVFITGGGGSGKTFSLLDFAYSELSKNPTETSGFHPIPIYIALNQLNTNKGTENAIEEMIVDKLSDMTSDEYIRHSVREQYENWVTDSESCYYPLLMLDGFNEVTDSAVQDCIVSEVNRLQNRSHCRYRFIITSRYDLSSVFSSRSGSSFNSQFEAYAMTDLKDEDIIDHVRKYLLTMRRSDENIQEIIRRQLMETDTHTQKPTVKGFLKKPMAVVLFCYMHEPNELLAKAVDHMPMNTLGELIAAFIAKVKLGNPSPKKIKSRDEQFLRYLGYRMNCDGVFTISGSRFEKYCHDYSELYHPKDIDEDTFYESTFITDILTIPENRSEISYRHQNYRDYFAAEYLKEYIVKCDIQHVNEYFGNSQIPQEVLVILADLLAEYNCVESGENSLVQRFFHNYFSECSHFPYDTPELLPSAIAELIRVSVLGRNSDLSAFDFSGLDLSDTRLNGIKLSRGENSGLEHTAKFEGALLAKETLNAAGHAGAVQMMLYIEPYLLTLSKRGFFAFNMKERVQYFITEYYEDAIEAAVTFEDKKEIVTGDRGGRLVRWAYSIDGEGAFSMTKLGETTITQPGASERRKRLDSIQSIVKWHDGLIVCLRNGDSYRCGSDLSGITFFTRFVELNQENYADGFQKYCKATVCHHSLYISYGKEIRRFKDLFSGFETIVLSMGDAYIHDIGSIAIKNTDKTELLFVNVRNVVTGQNRLASEILYSVDFQKMNRLTIREHSVTKQGFNGWNRFSIGKDSYGSVPATTKRSYQKHSDMGNRYAVYLSSNIEDTQNEAGFWEISFFSGGHLKPQLIPHYGNQHRMAVEYVLPFTFAMKNYVATGSVDRCTEIIRTDGGEDVLMCHLAGHTDGIHYLDVANEKEIYTAHYSGEIGVWKYSDRLSQWKCAHVVQAHRHWVWETKHIVRGDETFIVSCSYDHQISVINPSTEMTWMITEPKGRVLTFELFDDTILAAYDYIRTDGDKHIGHAVLRAFKVTDFSNGIYEAGKELELTYQIRFMRRIDDFILLCSAAANPGQIYSLDCRQGKFALRPPEVIHEIACNQRVNLRALDAVRWNENEYIFAAAGDAGDTHMIEIWNDSCHTTVYASFDRGISSICFCRYDGALYLFVGSYDANLIAYEVRPDEEKLTVRLCCVCSHADQVLNLQVLGQTLYVSLLSGSVLSWNIPDILHQGKPLYEEKDARLLFRTVTGLNICNVNFSGSCLPDWDESFRSIIKYYEYTD